MLEMIMRGIFLFCKGLAQYSGDPKTEWHLDAHRTRASLLDAVASLPYKGGNTLTGTSVLEFSFKQYSDKNIYN